MISLTGFEPWEFEFAFSGSLTSTFLGLDLTWHFKAGSARGAEAACLDGPLRQLGLPLQPRHLVLIPPVWACSFGLGILDYGSGVLG